MISPYRFLWFALIIVLLLPSLALTAAEKRPDYDRLLRTYAVKDEDHGGREAMLTLTNSSAPEAAAAIRKGVASHDMRIRRACADLLGSREDPGAAALLIGLLNDRDAMVRWEAVVSLMAIPLSSAAFEPLCARLADHDTDVRSAAVDAVSRYGSRAIDLLLKALSDPDPDIRLSVIRELSGKQDPRVAPAVGRLLSDPDLGESAAQALSSCGKPAVDVLLAALPASRGEVRSAIFSALHDIDDPRCYPALRTGCADPDPKVRAEAISHLSLNDPQALDLIYAALRDPDPKVRAEAVNRLPIDDPRSLDLFYAALCDPDAAVRENGYGKLNQLVLDKRAIEHLLPLLNDPDRKIRYFGTYHLSVLHDPAFVQPLLARLQQPDFPTTVIDGLGRLGDPRAVPALIPLLATPDIGKDDDLKYQYEGMYAFDASYALASIGAPAVGPLIAALQSDNPLLRTNAAGTLGRIADARVRPVLRNALHDPEPAVRVAAIKALATQGDVRDDAVLLPLLDDANVDIRCAAAGALFGWQDPRLIPPLAHMLASKDAHERCYAASVLGEMDDPAVAPLMLKAMKDKNDDVLTAVDNSTGAWINAPNMLNTYLAGKILEIDGPMVAYLDKRLHQWFDVSSRIERADPKVAVPVLIQRMQKGDSSSTALLQAYPGPAATQALLMALTVKSTRGEAAKILAKWKVTEAAPIAMREMTRLLHTDDPDRLDDLEALSALAGEKAVDLLAARLAQPVCKYEREKLVEALGATGDPRALELILGVVREDADFSMRDKAIEALGRLGDRRATPALIPMLQDREFYIRIDVIDAWGKLRDPRAVEPLLARLPDAYYPEQRHIVDALAAIGDQRAVKPLLAMLKPLPRPVTGAEVTVEVVKALGVLGDRDAADRLLPLLSACLYDGSFDRYIYPFRNALIEAMGNLHEKRALDLLITALRQDQSETAVRALRQIGGPRAADALLAALPAVGHANVIDSRTSQITSLTLGWQTTVGQALGQIKDDGQQQRLTETLQSDNWRVRFGAAVALGVTGEPWSEPLLEQARQDPQPQVRATAKQVLERLQGKAP